LSSPRALVIRDGAERRVPGREVVRGDVVVLAEGDRAPADATILESQDLQADESLLTGESVPVRKTAAASTEAPPAPGGDDLPFVYAGSLIVRGHGLAQVTATGPRSQLGRIGLAIGRIETEPPRLRAQTQRLVTRFAVISLSISASATILYGLLRGSWLNAVLSGIALSMSMLPEEFPLVLTVFMVAGAWRISRARVLTRRIAAIETLGSATVLCTDKTGTLTENRRRLPNCRSGPSAGSVPRQAHCRSRSRDCSNLGFSRAFPPPSIRWTKPSMRSRTSDFSGTRKPQRSAASNGNTG
jgi:Ca2+-transporting ATPase